MRIFNKKNVYNNIALKIQGNQNMNLHLKHQNNCIHASNSTYPT